MIACELSPSATPGLGQHCLVLTDEFRSRRCFCFWLEKAVLITKFTLEEWGCSFVIREAEFYEFPDVPLITSTLLSSHQGDLVVTDVNSGSKVQAAVGGETVS